MSELQSAANPESPQLLDEFRFFAVLGTWMEEDIVEATVKNAFTQGCERVYLVDNNSPDGTVQSALQHGATLARSFSSTRYDEAERLGVMNDVVREVSSAEGADHIWWLFLDADEFPHGPNGMTLRAYLQTLDQKFRVVGARFFDHYPSGPPYFQPGRHPLDFQPLCEELAYPMCARRHRKHPVQRYDRSGVAIECGPGFHSAYSTEQLYEPDLPVFLHHFPYREPQRTRQRLEALWAKDQAGNARATESRDTHMLTRMRSIDAVYAQKWGMVQNFIALDPAYPTLDWAPPPYGVVLKPWADLVPSEHRSVLRWYSMYGAWNYQDVPKYQYGDDVTYRRGLGFLDGRGTIEDWGCGFTHAKNFIALSDYIGIDGSSQYADKLVDLVTYVSNADCIFMRHVLEHNTHWERILENAIASFKNRMVLVVFTPWSDSTRVIATAAHIPPLQIPDISFRKTDITRHFEGLEWSEETLETDTQYKIEHIFYLTRPTEA